MVFLVVELLILIDRKCYYYISLQHSLCKKVSLVEIKLFVMFDVLN